MNLPAALLILAGSSMQVLECWCNYTTIKSHEFSYSCIPLFEVHIPTFCSYCRGVTIVLPPINGSCPRGPLDVGPVVRNLATRDLWQAAAPSWRRNKACPKSLRMSATFTEDTVLGRRCRASTEYRDSYSVPGLDNSEWSEENLRSDRHRGRFLTQAVHTHWGVTWAMAALATSEYYNFTFFCKPKKDVPFPDLMRIYSRFWRDSAKLFSVGVENMAKSFLPLAYEHMGNEMTHQQLKTWTKNMQTLWNQLQGRFSGIIEDLFAVSNQVESYKQEATKERPENYIVRRPPLSEKLLDYYATTLPLHEDFAAQCKPQVPEALQMLSFAESVYEHLYLNLFPKGYHSFDIFGYLHISVADEEWKHGPLNQSTVSVDTGCVQMLVDLLEHPACPLVELPRETAQRQEQCRLQLWRDIVRGDRYIPVTSYLAYTQKINVNICLLSWMVANPRSVCQNFPRGIFKSVTDAHCLLGNSEGQVCVKENNTEAICCVSRAMLSLKCPDIYSTTSQTLCLLDHSYNVLNYSTEIKQKVERKINYRSSINNNTLKYKDFKIQNLKGLEMSFIAVNIMFRFLTVTVYMILRQLRNVPGKLLLCFQFTGIIQILCSEVVYRMAGIPDLSTVVQVDSSLTLLGCMWLNAFCYQLFACMRHLRLPDDLLPAEVNQVFCVHLLCVMMPWSVVTAASVTLERLDEAYLFHSRVLFLAAVSLSVTSNIVLLGLVGYMWLRTNCNMQRLQISSNNKGLSKKQVAYMSGKAVVLSGVGIILRMGFHQAQGIAQVVYYVHVATMAQGPLLFILFVCNGTALPLLRDKLLVWWDPDVIRPGQELCSAAERNLRRRKGQQLHTLEASV